MIEKSRAANGGLSSGLEPLGRLVELGVLAARGVLVVGRHRALQVALGHRQLPLELLVALANGDDLRLGEHGAAVGLVVDDHEDPTAVVVERGRAELVAVLVLVHEAASLAIDQHALDQPPRRARGEVHHAPLHAIEGRAETEAETDRDAVARVGPKPVAQLQQLRRVLLQQGLVHHEAARAEDYAATRADMARLALDARPKARDARRLGRSLHHQPLAACAGLDTRAGGDGSGAQRLHQHQPATLAGVPGVVASRRGRCDGAEGVGELAARVGQAVLGAPGIGAALRREELRLERHPARDEPLVQLEAALAVRAQPLVRGAGPHRGAQVAVHLPGRVVEAAGALQRRASAEVDRSAREGARAAAGEVALQHQHAGARLGGLDRRGGPRRAEAGDDHVRLKVPDGNLGSGERRDRGGAVVAHSRGALPPALLRSG